MVTPRYCGRKPARSAIWYLFTIAPIAVLGRPRWTFLRRRVAPGLLGRAGT